MDNPNLKISIITVCLNSAHFILKTLESIRHQEYSNIEYIVIDGGSTDGTYEIIKDNAELIDYYISESDDGIYHAINKGLEIATGEVIGILNSDDIYASKNIISMVANKFENNEIDILYGDVLIIKSNNTPFRLYRANNFDTSSFNIGIMPPHPSVFIRKKIYENFGYYKTVYSIASDYDMLFRLIIIHKLKSYYLPITMVHMLRGGASSRNLRNIIKLNREIYSIHKHYNYNITIMDLLKKIPKRIKELLVLE